MKSGAKVEGTKNSLSEIVDQNNKSYGIGVKLDSTLLDNLTPKERVVMVKEYVKELGGEVFSAYDNNGNSVNITIAKSEARFKNKNGKSVPVNKDLTSKYINNEVKQEAIALVDELVITSKYDDNNAPLYAHDWLDDNGKNDWEYWTTYIQDKNNTIWEATLNIANTSNGEKILYDIYPIKKAGQSVKSDTSAANNIISQTSEKSSGNHYSLSAEQESYFKDSKVRDENGNLKVMYHGSHESFTVFDKKKARSSGTYGKGFYFTDSKSHAGTYGDSYEVYLNITNPLKDGTNDITKEQLRKFVEAIAEDEDYGIENYGYGATVDSVTDSVYGKSDFGMLLDLNVSCIGNMVEAVELFNEVNGTDYDGIVAPTETVAFYPNQIKKVDNTTPSTDPDIRYSLSEDVDNVEKILYDKNNSLSIVNRAKTYNNSSLKWVYDSEIFSVEESKLFHEKISEINQGSEAFSKNSADEYMIPIENKIIFTDGNYDSPYVREIVEVLTEYQTEFDDIRERIYNVEKGKSEKQYAARYVYLTYGKGRIVTYTSGVSGVYGWEDGKRKGKSRSSVIRNHLNKQFRGRDDRKSKETQINETAPINEASSKDGVFFDGEKTRVTNQGERKIAYDCGINKNRG